MLYPAEFDLPFAICADTKEELFKNQILVMVKMKPVDVLMQAVVIKMPVLSIVVQVEQSEWFIFRCTTMSSCIYKLIIKLRS